MEFDDDKSLKNTITRKIKKRKHIIFFQSNKIITRAEHFSDVKNINSIFSYLWLNKKIEMEIVFFKILLLV